MSDYFFDTSAIWKRYWTETGSSDVIALAQPSARNTLIIADLTRVEFISVLARLLREGKLKTRTAKAIQHYFVRHWTRQYRSVPYNDAIVTSAQNLLLRYPLRAADAIQLASALAANTRLVAAGLSPLVFVSADARLLSVTAGENLSTYLPS